MRSYEYVGKLISRPESAEKVTGTAQYTADIRLSNTLWGKSLHSPYPHARIVRIETQAAAALPGVFAILTGADLPAGMYGRAIKDIPVLAIDVVRFAGERVAAVAAVDDDTARQALDLIEVEYEELPAIFDVLEALKEDAPILHPEFGSYDGGEILITPTNAYSYNSVDRGNIELGFADAELIVENAFTTPRVHQGYLEPQSILVSVEGDVVNVWTSSKAPYSTRQALAAATRVPEEQIVFHHAYIGGDFGGKATPSELPIAYYLSHASGRPVRMVMDYLEEFMAGNPRHSTIISLKTGVKRDGTITAHHVQFYVNCGAYAGYKPGRVIGGANQAAGPYRIANTRIESTHVYTNLVPGGHMRAPGYVQAAFALESHIDDVARRLAIDPVTFRLRNLILEGDETAFGGKLEGVRVIETLRAAARMGMYSEPRPALVGRGVAVAEHSPGGGQGNGSVTFRPDGKVVIGTPIFDQGTGTYATLIQVVAEELTVPIDSIVMEIWNTDSRTFDSGIGGSRGSRIATAVAHEAAQTAKECLFRFIGAQLDWPEDKLVLRGSTVTRTDTKEVESWPTLLATFGEVIVGHARLEERGATQLTSFCAQVAEVAVDPETGAVTLLRFTSAHDVGRILNPDGHQGQIFGGFVQGLGYALMEDLKIEDGRVTSLSFGDYKLPTIQDIPEFQTVLLESNTGVGPYQIRGIGENSIVPVAPAIANAVADAVGARVRSLPLTAEKIYQALQEPSLPSRPAL